MDNAMDNVMDSAAGQTLAEKIIARAAGRASDDETHGTVWILLREHRGCGARED